MRTEGMPEVCDCLVFCGDDPWLASGKAKPCEYATIRAAEQKEAEKLNRVRDAGPELLEFAQWVLSLKTGGMIEGKARAVIAKATGATT